MKKSMRTKTPVAIALFLVGMVGACARTVSDHGGSETNWLVTCTADSDCSSGSCLCGVCTTVCAASDACTGGAGANTCATAGTTAHGTLCGDSTSAPAGVCVPGCGDGAVCGSGLQCVAGGCVPAVRKTASGITRTIGNTTFTDVISTVNDPASPGEPPTRRCLAAPPDIDVTGHTACSVIEVTPLTSGVSCASPGRTAPDPNVIAPTLTLMKERGICDVAGAPACSTFALCGVPEMTGSALQSCQQDAQIATDAQGWCLVDPQAGSGSAAVASQCAGDQLLRINVSNLGGPGREGHVFLHCSTTTSNDAPAASTPGQIGDPCTPGDETRPDFAGFSELEVNVETGSPQCSTGVCLASHFRGRASCTYGQPGIPGGDPTQADPTQQRCTTAGPNPVPVTVPVTAQLTERRPETSVYCSCRCDGPEADAQYCACPSGFTCTKQVTDYGFGTGALAGSYCVKDGTQVQDPTQLAASNKCSATVLDCGPLP